MLVYHTFEHAVVPVENHASPRRPRWLVLRRQVSHHLQPRKDLAGHVEVVGDRLGGDAPVRHYDLTETGEPEVGSLAQYWRRAPWEGLSIGPRSVDAKSCTRATPATAKRERRSAKYSGKVRFE